MSEYNWSTHQLTEFYTALSASESQSSAIAVAVERAAEMVEAEVGAVVIDAQIYGCWGFGSQVPGEGLLAVAREETKTLTVPDLGELFALPSELTQGGTDFLVIARVDDEFGPEERQMLQGMAQILGLTLRSIQVLAAERKLRAEREREAAERLVLLEALQTRQRLVETLLAIQRAISHRQPLSEILDAVTSGAAELLDGALVALVLVEPDSKEHFEIASSSGNGDFAEADRSHSVARQAMDTGTALICSFDPERLDLGSVIAAPVYLTGKIAGCLLARLPGMVEQHAEQREQIAAFAQQVSLALADAHTVEAVRRAHLDPLTGLPNRALFLQIFNRVLAARRPNSQPTNVLFIDLDHFKAVNDRLGHEAGDQLLAAAATRIQGCLRSDDTTARLGGDEFAVIMNDLPVEAAKVLGERVIIALNRPFRLGGHDAFIGASIGVAATSATAADSDELLRNADVAMYRAKKAGRSRIVVFEPHMHSEAVDDLSLRSDLQTALRDAEFRLQFQPFVYLSTGATAGVEALLRWHHPTRGLIEPSDFIPMAEDTGLIVDVGRWVLEHSAMQVAHWRKDFPELTLNVNVSGRQLVDPGFVDKVAQALVSARLPAHSLTLELTESVLMDDPASLIGVLNNLKQLGIQLAIDDFGTGYASLSYLRDLPVDELKIDPSFIAKASRSREDLAIVRMIVALGDTLGLRVVAEGIEQEAQLEILQRLDCRLGQGSYLCGPTDPADLPAALVAASLTAGPAGRRR